MGSPTLIRPPPSDSSKSPMENVLELTRLSDIGPVSPPLSSWKRAFLTLVLGYLYQYPVSSIPLPLQLPIPFPPLILARELLHPPGARGVYGGGVIAQCLSAAFETVSSPSSLNGQAVFLPHSMHCYFVLAGDSTIPILYHVERVREGRSSLTRTVQARQRGKCIFTTTISFMKEGSGGDKAVEHGWDMHEGVREGLERPVKQYKEAKDEREAEGNGVEMRGPFMSRRLGILNSMRWVSPCEDQRKDINKRISDDSPLPQTRRPQAWIRCRGSLSPSGGPQAHLSALAYMSDSWFIGTVSLIHHLTRFSQHASSHPPSAGHVAKTEMANHESYGRSTGGPKSNANGSVNTPEQQPQAGLGMMVSLDHTIYFHRPREVKADDWLFSEMESPWAGEGRGLVMQRIWNKQGRLLASCVQEVCLPYTYRGWQSPLLSFPPPVQPTKKKHSNKFAQGLVRLKQDQPPARESKI